MTTFHNDDHDTLETSPEVYSVIYARHKKELVAFGSYSSPNGDQFGNPNQAVMFTSWGIKGSDFPLIEVTTTWDVNHTPGHEYKRDNEKHRYYLCLPRECKECG